MGVLGQPYRDFLETPFPVIEAAVAAHYKLLCKIHGGGEQDKTETPAQPERSPDEVASGLMAALRGHKAFKGQG